MGITSFSTNHRLLTAVIVGGLFYLAGHVIALQPVWLVPRASTGEISVSGTGEVTAQPDVATVSFGVDTGPLPSSEVALSTLAERMNRVIAAIREQGVEEDDITTQNLSINPDYDFRDGERVLRGFTANQSVRVKIRDLDKVGTIVAATTSQGVNQLGGIVFAIDDPTALQQEAEEKAITQAKERAKELAGTLGVRLGRLVDYQTDSADFSLSRAQPAEPFALFEDSGIPAPDVPGGSQDIVSTVTITYRIK